MTACSYCVLLFVCHAVYILSQVFSIESIIGGRLADLDNFKHHVGIFSKLNYTSVYNDVCSGAIVHNFFIVSTVNCFTNRSLEIKIATFFITVSTSNIYEPNIEIEIDIIYLPINHTQALGGNIAVAKLKESLQLEERKELISTIEFSEGNYSFNGKMGVVSGYGYNWIQKGIIETTGEIQNFFGGSDGFLYYAESEIVDFNYCKNFFPNFNNRSSLCGTVKQFFREQPTDFSLGDVGNPLVIDNKLVGLISLCLRNSDASIYAIVYTKVSFYIEFINRIIGGHWTEIAIAYLNLPHKPPPCENI